jgi:hypothetical protein
MCSMADSLRESGHLKALRKSMPFLRPPLNVSVSGDPVRRDATADGKAMQAFLATASGTGGHRDSGNGPASPMRKRMRILPVEPGRLCIPG